MVENVSAVRDVAVERPRPPEPQEAPPPREQRQAASDGEPTPPNLMSMLSDQSGAALLRVQEAVDDYESAEALISAADTDGDKAIAREELQKLIERNMGEQSADTKAASDRLFDKLDADRSGTATADELNAARAQAKAINIGA